MSAEPAGAERHAARPAPSFSVAAGLLAFAMFVVVTTEFFIVGLLPAMAGDLGVSLAETGWFITCFAAAAALIGPPLTMLAARCEPRTVLVAGVLLFAAGNLTAALVPHYSIVVAMRLLQGCALPVVASVAIVAGARLAGAGSEGRATSQVNFGVVAATVLGIPGGAMLADAAGWPASFAVLALVGFIAAALIAVQLPRLGMTHPPSLRTEASLLWRPSFLVHLLLSGLLFAGMFAGYTYVAALFAALPVAAAGFDGAVIGWMLMGFGLAGVFGNWLAGRVVDRDPLAATAGAALALAFAMAGIGLAGGSLIVLALLVGLWGAAHMAAFVFCQVSAMTAGREAPAFAMSLNISVCNLGIALGAAAGGKIVDHFGAGAVGYGGGAIAAAAMLMAVAMMAMRAHSGTRR